MGGDNSCANFAANACWLKLTKDKIVIFVWLRMGVRLRDKE